MNLIKGAIAIGMFVTTIGAGILSVPASTSVSSEVDTTERYVVSTGIYGGKEYIELVTSTTSVTELVTTTATTTCTYCEETNDSAISLTDGEIYMLATLVELEAGIEPYECKKAVASTVINRMTMTGTDLVETIYAPNQYSVSNDIAYSSPSDEALEAVNDVVRTGVTLPEYVTFFRAGYYHNWGDQTPYICIGNTYFSYSASLKSNSK